MAKQQIKERIKISNENVKNGLPADPWVILFRIKNNEIKATWKAAQPKKEKKPRKPSETAFKKGSVPHNIKSHQHKLESLERWRENTRQWHKDNRERINKQRRERRRIDINFKLACNLRKRLSFLLRMHTVNKTVKTMTLLGCDITVFVNHIKSLFTEGMTMDNYGQWHLDHIKPCDSFDLTNPEKQAECFHYSNIQPLWALDNRIKSNKVLRPI